jgi:hypothetical protein
MLDEYTEADQSYHANKGPVALCLCQGQVRHQGHNDLQVVSLRVINEVCNTGKLHFFMGKKNLFVSSPFVLDLLQF